MSEDSGIIVLGQSMDQSTVFSGRDRRRRMFWRCSRKMGTLENLSIPDPMRWQSHSEIDPEQYHCTY